MTNFIHVLKMYKIDSSSGRGAEGVVQKMYTRKLLTIYYFLTEKCFKVYNILRLPQAGERKKRFSCPRVKKEWLVFQGPTEGKVPATLQIRSGLIS